MDDRAGTGDSADTDIPGRLNMKVAGPAIAAGAVSLGLVLIGACGIGHKDVYVAPPPLAADLQTASTSIQRNSTTAPPAVLIPPSPSWRVAANTPPRRTTSATVTGATTTTGSEPTYTPYSAPTTTSRTPTSTSDRYDSERDPWADDSTTTTTRPYTPHPAEDPYSEPATSDPGIGEHDGDN